MSSSNSAFRASRLPKCSLMIFNLAACSGVIYPSMASSSSGSLFFMEPWIKGPIPKEVSSGLSRIVKDFSNNLLRTLTKSVRDNACQLDVGNRETILATTTLLQHHPMRARASPKLSGIVWTMARTRRKQTVESISPLMNVIWSPWQTSSFWQRLAMTL